MFSSKWKLAGSGSIRLLGFTMIVVIVSLLPLRQAMAATTWTVTVTYDASGIRYTVSGKGDCPSTPATPIPDPDEFNVCYKDTVQFVASTSNKKDELLVVIPDAILDDNALFHKPTQHFHVSDGQQTKGGYVNTKPSAKKYKYYISLVDKSNGTINCKDPKIIIAY